PASSTRRNSSHQTFALSVRLMKPGPATSAEATFPSLRSLAAMLSASSRGFLPASFARTIAALVAISPCVGSRGGSTTIRETSAPEPSTAVVAACTQASIVANKCCGLAWLDMRAAANAIPTASQNQHQGQRNAYLMVAPLSTEMTGPV